MNNASLLSKRSWITPIALSLIAGCTSVPSDLGRSDVNDLLIQRGIVVDAVSSQDADSFISTLTAEPLTAANAARIALINNPNVKVRYAELGFSAADLYEGGRIRNPVFSAILLDSSISGNLDQNTFGLVTSITDLLTLPARKRYAEAEFAVAKQQIGAAIMQIAVDAEIAYYDYVAAKQVSALRERVSDAGDLSQKLAERYRNAGNLTPRDLALARAGASDTRVAALESQAQAYAERTALANILGLPIDGEWDAPSQLEAPRDSEDALLDLVTLAQRSRLDISAATAHAKNVSTRLGLTQWSRWLGELEVGIEAERETDGGRLTGGAVSWEVPIFNQNRDQILRVDADLQIALADLERLILSTDNNVRLAYASMMNARARFEEMREHLIPQRIAATARAQEEQNFMLIGIFEVLATKQEEYDAYQLYLETVRDYWVARTNLSRAVGSTLPSTNVRTEILDVDDYIRPAPVGSGHSGHGGHAAAPEAISSMGEDMNGMDHSKHNMTDVDPHAAHGGSANDTPVNAHSGHGAPSQLPVPETDAQPKPEKPAHEHNEHSAHGDSQ